ncbi:hypothetical protein P4I22_31460, partial [Escherichia coli]|uniref:hypothetical protein n=1 Tax=Escherichia coli TaxID=562 RepID=UPI003CECE79A
FRADAGLTALKRLYKGAAGSPVAPFPLLALCGHEQPDCQEGRFPPGTGVSASFKPSFASLSCFRY